MRHAVEVALLLLLPAALLSSTACSDRRGPARDGAARWDGDGGDQGPPNRDLLRVSVQGEYCPPGGGGAQSAAVRLVVLLDRSASAKASDPGELWVDAITTLANAHASSTVLTIAVVAYNGLVEINPGIKAKGFVTPSALQALRPPDHTRWDDLEAAIAAARSLISADIAALQPAQRAATRFVVHLISDGGASPNCFTGCDPVHPTTPAPHPDDVLCNQPRSQWCSELLLSGSDCATLEQQFPTLQQCGARNTLASLYYAMQQLAYHVEASGSRLDLRVAQMLSSDPTYYDPDADGRLAQLAQGTRPPGIITRYKAAADLDLSRFELAPPNGAADVRETALLAVDHGLALDGAGHLVKDSDSDGVGDDDERRDGTDPARRDSNGDGVSDGVALRLGSSSGALCAADERVADGDHDGLNDCEERLVGTDRGDPDSDGDGVPDGVEVLYGLDALSALDGADELRRRLGQRALPDGDTGCVQLSLQDVARAPDRSRLALYLIGGTGSPSSFRLLGAACPASSATSVTVRAGNYLSLERLRSQSNAAGVSPCAP